MIKPVYAIIAAASLSATASAGIVARTRDAIERGLVRVQSAASNYPNHRDCFSCHHQTLPVVAMHWAKNAGSAITSETLEETIAFTSDSFEKQRENLERGTGVGGTNMTVGYGLWTLWGDDRPADELTDKMVTFLLKNQESNGRWKSNKGRPPLEGSDVTATTLAMLGLNRFARGDQRSQADAAIERGLSWLHETDAESNEDFVFRLWGLWMFDDEETAWTVARSRLLRNQHSDGGWSQLDSMESDAYATGQALFVLRLTGLNINDPTIKNAQWFLIRSQLDDGSWKVETRARAFQTFFDNGDPHGRSQFISTSATCWAVAGLASTQGPFPRYAP
jgi:Prenyltransferase and squalene oxidase repeat